MKIKFSKWIGLLAATMLLVDLTSCIKDKAFKGETDLSGLQDHVLLLNSGVDNVSKANVAFNTDTATITITANLASVDLPTSPVDVTLGVDAAQIDAYNASHSSSFVLLPDSAYSLASTKVTIPAGQQFATTTISFYKSKLDPSLS